MDAISKRWVIGLATLNVVLFLILAGLLLTRGPGGSEDEASASASESSETAQTPDGGATDPASAPQPSASQGEPEPELAPIPDGARDVAAFVLPSGNISCDLQDSALACTILNATFEPPPGDGCEWRGQIVTLDAAGVFMPCPPQQPAATEGLPSLNYGESTAVGVWVCSSSEQGLECYSREDGTGFTLARSSFTSYGPGRLT